MLYKARPVGAQRYVLCYCGDDNQKSPCGFGRSIGWGGQFCKCIIAADERWDGRRGIEMKVSRRVLLFPPSWHRTEPEQVRKPDRSGCLSLLGIRIQIKCPASPPSPVWSLQPAGGCLCGFKSAKAPPLPGSINHTLFNTHWIPPLNQLHLSRDTQRAHPQHSPCYKTCSR